MPDQDIFNDTPKDKEDTAATPPSPNNSLEDKLKLIVNENGEPKYKDVESALEALVHSQQFIQTLKTEKSEVESQFQQAQAELEKRSSVEDTVKKLFGDAEPQKKEDQPTQGGFDESKIQTLVEQMLEQRESQSQATKNLNQVTDILTQKYGDNVKEIIAQRAKELNTSPAELRNLSSSNPKMALEILGAADVKAKTTPSTGSVIPPTKRPDDNPPPKFEGSLLYGATSAQIKDAWKQNQDYVYKKLGVES